MHPSPSSEARFRRLFDDHEVAMREYLSRRLGPQEANDAAAEVFLVAWRKIDALPAGDEARLWLYGVARHVVDNARRTTRRRMRLAAKAARLSHHTVAGTEEQLVRRSEDALVLEALATLRPDDQELLRLRTWEELSSAELATVFGIKPGAVDMRLTRAKKRLAAALQRAGFVSDRSVHPHAAEETGT